MLPRPSGTVALLTDFGTRDPYVGIVKGMVLRSCPKAVLVDLCHEVPPQDVAVGAFFLRAAAGRFPAGTVLVSVVDPGVGTARRVLCAAAHECYWIAPDNGLLGDVLASAPGAEVRAVALEHLGLLPRSRTFHGRDVFAPLAGSLAAGRFGFTALGPRAGDVVRLPALCDGPPRVVLVDGYGNLLTNVVAGAGAAAGAAAGARALRIADRTVTVRDTYADAAPGELLALANSYDLLEIAQNGGSAAAALAVGRGEPVHLETTR